MISKIRHFSLLPVLAFTILIAAFLVKPVFPQTASQNPQNATTAIIMDISRLLSEFKFKEALSLFDTINPADAGTTEIRLLKASVLASAGMIAEARTIAESITKAEPNNVNALYIFSTIENAAGKTKEQRSLLERVIKADPTHLDALIDLGELCMGTNDNKNAGQYFDKALELSPENMDALLGRARVYRLAKDPHKAEELYNRTISLYPTAAAAWQDRARLYRGVGFPIQALADLDKAKSLDPKDYWIAIDRGSTLLDLNRKKDALEEYQRAIKINPDFFLAYAYTSGIKDEFGDIDGAGKDYEMLAKLKPDYPYGFEGLAFHKMRDGKWAEARDAFAEAYKLLPNDWYYGLLAAINWMKATDQTGPRQYLNQSMNKLKRENVEYLLFRLFYDLSGRVYAGENDILKRIDQETNQHTKARLLFYVANYYDIRGIENLANKYYIQCLEINQQNLPEWRLIEWITEAKGIKPF